MGKISGWIGGLLLLMTAASSLGAELGGDALDKRVKRADSLISSLVAPREPGVAVLVAQNGKAIYIATRGVADLMAMRPIDGRTAFRLASLSKAFTAMATMLLVRDGKLRYEDSLTDIFPDFPSYGRDITVRHLLQHTSGLPDYEDLMPRADPSAPVEATQILDREVFELLKRQPAGWFAPGSLWRYSNSGYVVLGLIVERVSGRPFPKFLEERIFAPLGMVNTVAYVRGRNTVTDRAWGYAKSGGRWTLNDQSPTSATLGDGGIYSSLADLLQWDEALLRRRLLSDEDMRPALTPVRVPGKGPTGPDGSPADYGFGWYLNAWQGHARMWHHGETAGFRTAIQRFTDDGLTVIVLANRTDLDALGLSLKIAALFLEDGRPR